MSFLKQIFRKAARTTKTKMPTSSSSSTIASFLGGSDSCRSLASLCDGPAKETMIDLGLLADLNEARQRAAEEAQYWAGKVSPVILPPVDPIGDIKVLEGRRRRVCVVVERKWNESW